MIDLPAVTTAQIRDVDRRAIEEYGLPGLVLMENAGRGAAAVAGEMLPSPESAAVMILCGKGNNGGDGFVIARHLHNARATVQVALLCRIEDIAPDSDAGVNLHVARRMGIPIAEVLDAESAAGLGTELTRADLVVDALLGTGLSGRAREPARTAIEQINACGRPVLAIDTPSGLCGDTGQVRGAAVKATRTATFAAPKKGFFAGAGPSLVGQLHIVDIGVPRELMAQIAESR